MSVIPPNRITPFRVVEEPPMPSIYCNGSRLAFGLYDFRMLFSEVMANSDGEFVQVDRVSIVMSPQHTKKFVETVSAKVREYEERFGAIPEDEPQKEESE
jgi:hypothetical protein